MIDIFCKYSMKNFLVNNIVKKKGLNGSSTFFSLNESIFKTNIKVAVIMWSLVIYKLALVMTNNVHRIRYAFDTENHFVRFQYFLSDTLVVTNVFFSRNSVDLFHFAEYVFFFFGLSRVINRTVERQANYIGSDNI